NPFKGKVIAHNEALTSGSSENDNGCTDLGGYNTDLTDEGCILGTSLDETDTVFDPSFIAANPGFGDLGKGGSGGGNGTGAETDCRLPAATNYTNLVSWVTYSAGDLMATGTTVTGVCDAGYAGSPTITCTDGSWGSLSGSCISASSCQVPATSTYTGVDSWNGVTEGDYISDTVALTGTCATGYTGSFSATCNSGSFDAPTSECTLASTECEEFDYTGASQTFTVPAGVTSVKMQVWGGEGGSHTDYSILNTGGQGGYSEGNLAVTPAQTLYVYIGGKGGDSVGYTRGAAGWNGGEAARTSGTKPSTGGGGGGTDIRTATSGVDCTGSDPRVIVAGGGGAGGYGGSPAECGRGGNGGGTTGVDGLLAQPGYLNGTGGTQSEGGCSIYSGSPVDCSGCFQATSYYGGGGGWYAGGGGSASGSGGGSGYIGGITGGTTSQGGKTGNGFARICWGSNTACDGGSSGYTSNPECD
ncbi:glycine rich domain-containing protein, partial [Pseudomonadota bacterium]